MRLNEVYPAEIARLKRSLFRPKSRVERSLSGRNRAINEVYPVEIARLNKIYSAEIARLNKTYSTEIARLNEVYPDEITRLNAALGELDTSQDTFQKSRNRRAFQRRTVAGGMRRLLSNSVVRGSDIGC